MHASTHFHTFQTQALHAHTHTCAHQRTCCEDATVLRCKHATNDRCRAKGEVRDRVRVDDGFKVALHLQALQRVRVRVCGFPVHVLQQRFSNWDPNWWVGGAPCVGTGACTHAHT